ncbi:type II secretion system protein [Candidatus Peregrinibacteria bacterium]|nr:type II secretion system protein [Candidatus Peregrinibacteria bacterium]
MKKSPAFTLVEVLISITVIAIISLMASPLYSMIRVRNNLELAANVVAQNMRRAQILAEASREDSDWSIRVEPGKVTIYKGNDFETRDASFDEVSELSSDITPQGVLEVTFSEFSGLPNATGILTFVSNENETHIITIGAKGSIHS